MHWVLALVCNLTHINKAFETIIAARTQGQWIDDIVIVVPEDVYKIAAIRDIAMKIGIEFCVLPEINEKNLLGFWDNHKEHENYKYVNERHFQYQKFFLMHTFFKRWTNVFYLDAGIKIHGNLNRLRDKCTEKNILYAHSDSYPLYEMKLLQQFCVEMDEEITNKLKSRYNLDCNYFQSTILIYDTNIIQPDTVSRLFQLKEEFPISSRNDQGIFNLHLLKERNLWKQLPLVDEQVYLYDYHNRPGIPKEKYLLLKAYH